LNLAAARNDALTAASKVARGGGGVASQGKRRRNVGGEGGEFGGSDAPAVNTGAYSAFCAAATIARRF